MIGSPALFHGDVTVKSIFWGRGWSSQHTINLILFCYFTNTCSFDWITLFSTPILFLKNSVRHINILQNLIVSFSKVSMIVIIMFLSFVILMAHDLYCIVLSTHLTTFILFPKLVPCHFAEHVYFHLKTPNCSCWDIQVKVSHGFKALAWTTLLPRLAAHICAWLLSLEVICCQIFNQAFDTR